MSSSMVDDVQRSTAELVAAGNKSRQALRSLLVGFVQLKSSEKFARLRRDPEGSKNYIHHELMVRHARDEVERDEDALREATRRAEIAASRAASSSSSSMMHFDDDDDEPRQRPPLQRSIAELASARDQSRERVASLAAGFVRLKSGDRFRMQQDDPARFAIYRHNEQQVQSAGRQAERDAEALRQAISIENDRIEAASSSSSHQPSTSASERQAAIANCDARYDALMANVPASQMHRYQQYQAPASLKRHAPAPKDEGICSILATVTGNILKRAKTSDTVQSIQRLLILAKDRATGVDQNAHTKGGLSSAMSKLNTGNVKSKLMVRAIDSRRD